MRALITAALLVACVGFAPGQTYVLRASVFDGGGTKLVGQNLRCKMSVGQQVASRTLGLSSGYRAILGFWHSPYDGPPVGVKEAQVIISTPLEFSLAQNAPNPFGRLTAIRYSLPQESDVVLRVYDPAGRTVATLVQARQRPGRYTVTWNVSGVPASTLPLGTYFYRLEAGEFTATRKLVKLE
jgi:hypothetical protein